MSNQTLQSNETLQAVCCAISGAEATVRDLMKLYYHDASEEFITYLYYSHMKHNLEEASLNKRIEKAFLLDLSRVFQNCAVTNEEFNRQLQKQADGIVAEICLHNKRQEGKTGGDFGLVIIHPIIVKPDDKHIVIRKGLSSGLLYQAKLRNKHGRWGSLKKNQQAILQKRKHLNSMN